jgi:hypothetical protein
MQPTSRPSQILSNTSKEAFQQVTADFIDTIAYNDDNATADITPPVPTAFDQNGVDFDWSVPNPCQLAFKEEGQEIDSSEYSPSPDMY